jgi:hypothetical protein
MARLVLALPLAALLPLLACKEDEAADTGKAVDDGKAVANADDGKAEAEDGKAADDGKVADDGKADGGDAKDDAAGDPVPPGETVTACPKSLAGKETFSRTIGKACGTVPVTADYKIEGGTLTLQAGAKLDFAPGAGLQVGYYEASKLVVEGTEAEPVVLTSSGRAAPGAWRGVQLYGKAAGSTIAHAVIEHAGDKKAALHIEAPDVAVTHTKIRSTKDHAIEVRGAGTLAAFTANTLEPTGAIAMRVSAPAAATVGEGNTFAAGSAVQIDRGKVQAETTWHDIGAPWLVTGRVDVHGEPGTPAKLRIAPGNELRFDGDGHIQVGYNDEGTLEAFGEADKPIVFDANGRTEAGSWRGLVVQTKGEAKISHAVFRNGGKKEKEGALFVAADGKLELSDSKFENDRVGIVLAGDEVQVQKLDGVTFTRTPVAIDLPATKLHAVGTKNTYEGEPTIVVGAGTIVADSVWHPQPGAKVQLEGKLQVKGAKLTVEAGSEIRVKDGMAIEIGYADVATLELSGTADRPIRIVGMRDVPGIWKGIVLFDKAKANVLSHVILRNAGGSTGAVELKRETDAKIDGLACEKCSTPTLAWVCASKLEKTGVEAKDDTPTAEAPPEKCE